MAKKYSYTDWWEGGISLNTCQTEYDSKELKDPFNVDWSQIVESDVLKIKSKQQELFQSEIQSTFTLFKNNFIKKYENSRLKEQFLEEQIQECLNVMFGELKHIGDLVCSEHWNVCFNNLDFQIIQTYAKMVFKNGLIIAPDFMHSPNCVYQDKNKITNQVYAEACWEYYAFLRAFRVNPKELSTPEEISSENSPEAIENPFPHIFKNLSAYLFFEELRKMTVNDKTYVADYSFIYHKLSDPKLKAIVNTVGQAHFCDFLKDELKLKEIYPKKLPYKNPDYKQATYNSLLSKFKEEIER